METASLFMNLDSEGRWYRIHPGVRDNPHHPLHAGIHAEDFFIPPAQFSQGQREKPPSEA